MPELVLTDPGPVTWVVTDRAVSCAAVYPPGKNPDRSMLSGLDDRLTITSSVPEGVVSAYPKSAGAPVVPSAGLGEKARG